MHQYASTSIQSLFYELGSIGKLAQQIFVLYIVNLDTVMLELLPVFVILEIVA